MSRSRRRNPIFGFAPVASEANWKATAARKLRQHVRQVLADDQERAKLSGQRWEATNPDDGPKDGKHWFASARPDHMRT